jgi:hypothetical protein
MHIITSQTEYYISILAPKWHFDKYESITLAIENDFIEDIKRGYKEE